MINSGNAVEFNFTTSDGGEMLPLPDMVPLVKFNPRFVSQVPHHNTKLTTNTTGPQPPNVFELLPAGIAINAKDRDNMRRQQVREVAVKERVKVQHLQTHTNLQNNRWNCHSFFNVRPDTDKDLHNYNNNYTNNNNNNNTSNTNNNNVDNESAFNDCNKKDLNYTQNASGGTDCTKDQLRRTPDQETAYRCIEDVHNYAKHNRCLAANDSSNSSLHDEDDEDEEDPDIDLLEDDYEGKQDEMDSTYETFYRKRHIKTRKAKAAAYADIHVDVETVTPDSFDATAVCTEAPPPDHHARRPMNAFLIFCKRHRAIVKKRYTTLENRAITKILGDWWASLDGNEKQCFTNLAQQNKDAFFSANPNFKWYKLPAPPLRTLNTRPTNAEANYGEAEFEDNQNYTKSATENIFRLADEAQMGELSSLMRQCPLQRALGETSQYLSTRLEDLSPLKEDKGSKRKLHAGQSFSSNSSEEDLVPKKSARTCKGKIYQELINSGQIAAVAKKMRSPKGHLNETHNGFLRNETSTANQGMADGMTAAAGSMANKRSPSESGGGGSPNYDLFHFDLEARINELPALSLDAYLQRKRNTKKKKKFNSKKRNSNSASSNRSSSSTATLQSPPITPPKEAPPQPAVGSQKRKARKESITRRDVSGIESEVASLIALSPDYGSVNGCYYLKEGIVGGSGGSCGGGGGASGGGCTPAESGGNLAPLTLETNHLAGGLNNLNDSISSTSDLLILAEVAANRTELMN